jgi:hypothetical protein
MMRPRSATTTGLALAEGRTKVPEIAHGLPGNTQQRRRVDLQDRRRPGWVSLGRTRMVAATAQRGYLASDAVDHVVDERGHGWRTARVVGGRSVGAVR